MAPTMYLLRVMTQTYYFENFIEWSQILFYSYIHVAVSAVVQASATEPQTTKRCRPTQTMKIGFGIADTSIAKTKTNLSDDSEKLLSVDRKDIYLNFSALDQPI